MPTAPRFQKELIKRYDRPGPRYTSYPPATEFHDRIDEADFRQWARQSNEELIPKPLSLYFHVPLHRSVGFWGACSKLIRGSKHKVEPYLCDLHREIGIQSRLFDRDREVRQLHWGGGAPVFLARAQAAALMEQIARHFNLRRDDECEYSVELDPRAVEADGIGHLRELGFNRVSLGVPDLEPGVQKALDRTARIIAEARRHGFGSVSVDLTFGLPRQTVESFSKTLDLVTELGPERIAIHNHAQSPQRLPPQSRVRNEDLPSTADKLNILNLAINRLCDAGYEYIGMDHFAKADDELAIAQRRGGLHRNFQGYSAKACCDSIGFGVSAISQVGDNFSQNTTSPEAYHEALANNRLPVVRGLHSDDDDLMRREIIQDLACHLELDLQGVEQRWNIDFDQHFADELARLEDMQNDGLVEVSRDQIRVLDAGRLLLRNICMVFDRYHRADKVVGLFPRTV